MTIEEAIVHCEDIVNDENLINCDDCKADYKQLAEWLKELIVLRKKQIPKKTKLIKRCSGIITFYPCPNCSTPEKYVSVYPKQKYCDNCGQKLLWGEEE